VNLGQRALELVQVPSVIGHEAALADFVEAWARRHFRDDEVVRENVRCLGDGETVSTTGTHLGPNLPDRSGNRYCSNLVSVAAGPVGRTAEDESREIRCRWGVWYIVYTR